MGYALMSMTELEQGDPESIVLFHQIDFWHDATTMAFDYLPDLLRKAGCQEAHVDLVFNNLDNLHAFFESMMPLMMNGREKWISDESQHNQDLKRWAIGTIA